MASPGIPEAIIESDDALAGLAGKMQFEIVGKEMVAVAAYAVQRQAMPEPAK
jgi:hypothetical protein